MKLKKFSQEKGFQLNTKGIATTSLTQAGPFVASEPFPLSPSGANSHFTRSRGNVIRQVAGFTLLELMVVVGLIAILAAIALPSYSEFVVRTKLRDGTEGLSSFRGIMEQAFQDNRTYIGGDGCLAVPASTPVDLEFFTLTCAGTATTFTLTATSQSDAGLGAAGDYVFTIDQDGVRDTTAYKGVDPVVDDWVYKVHD